ncbi:MAG: transcriptional regulator [Sphaerochaeta associata]|uniref:transcriptional regulator n=1 Tax=Sphaerochaeta associata TaxID=1129264 RepID=UPI002B20C28C|nr:transcriptional regulator [Sphaerochaeta associata]MEA5108511.1 transcriptional regulator [Sphaerochaeta associata]
MATTVDFIEFVVSQIDENWQPLYKKMFGEYMVYIHRKPLFLVCDNTVYAKQLENLKDVLAEAEKGFPYQGAKEHYIVDAEDREQLEEVIQILEPLIPVPVKRPRKKKLG